MSEKELNEIRKFFWNYKYSENYNEEIYEEAVRLIQYIDSKKL